MHLAIVEYYTWLFESCKVTVLSVNGLCNKLQMPYVGQLLSMLQAQPVENTSAAMYLQGGQPHIMIAVVHPDGKARAYFVQRKNLIDAIAHTITTDDDGNWVAWRGTVSDSNHVPEFVTNMLYQLPAQYVTGRFPALDHNIWGFNSMQSARALPKEAEVLVHKEAARSFDLARFANINVYVRDGCYWDAVTDAKRPALKPYDAFFHCTKTSRAGKCQCVPACPDPAAVALAYRSVCGLDRCILANDEDKEALVLRYTGLSYKRALRFFDYQAMVNHYAKDDEVPEDALPTPTDMGEALDRLVQWGGFMRPLLAAILPATEVFTTITRMRRVAAEIAYDVVKDIGAEVYDYVPLDVSEMVGLARKQPGVCEPAFQAYYDVVAIPYDVLACDLDLTFDADPEQRLRWFMGKSQGTALMVTDDMVRGRPGASYSQLDDGVVVCLPKAVTADARGAAMFAVVASPPPAHEGARLHIFPGMARDFMHGTAREVLWVVRTMLYMATGSLAMAMECTREFTDEELRYMRTTVPTILDAAMRGTANIPPDSEVPDEGEYVYQRDVGEGLLHLFLALVFYNEECANQTAPATAPVYGLAGDVIASRPEYTALADVIGADTGSGLGYAPLIGLFVADMRKRHILTPDDAQLFLIGFQLTRLADAQSVMWKSRLSNTDYLTHPNVPRSVGCSMGRASSAGEAMFDFFRFVEVTEMGIAVESTAMTEYVYASALRYMELNDLDFPLFIRHADNSVVMDCDALPVTRCRGVTDPITDLDAIRVRCTTRTDRGTTVQPSPFCGADPAVVSHILQHGIHGRGHQKFIHDEAFGIDAKQAPSSSQPELDFIQQGTTAARK
jgi:hypothetical protein